MFPKQYRSLRSPNPIPSGTSPSLRQTRALERSYCGVGVEDMMIDFGSAEKFHCWKKMPSCDEFVGNKRSKHTVVNYKSDLFIFGGDNGTSMLNDLLIFDVEKKSWGRAITTGTPPAPRYHHSAVIHQGSMFIFGGYTGDISSTSSFINRNDLHEYRFSLAQWFEWSFEGRKPVARAAHGAAEYEGRLWVFAGYDGNVRLNDMWVTSLVGGDKHVWEEVEQSGSIPPTCCNFALAVWQHHMYVFSGQSGAKITNHLFQFDFATRIWTRLNTDHVVRACHSAPVKRYGHTMVTHKDDLYVFGGVAGNHSLNDIYRFDLSARKWVSVELSDTDVVPLGRLFHSCAVVGDAMFVFGGTVEHHVRSRDMYRFQFSTLPPCTLKSDFGRLLTSNQFTDVEFIVGEEEEVIPAHIAIVCARSHVLKSRVLHARNNNNNNSNNNNNNNNNNNKKAEVLTKSPNDSIKDMNDDDDDDECDKDITKEDNNNNDSGSDRCHEVRVVDEVLGGDQSKQSKSPLPSSSSPQPSSSSPQPSSSPPQPSSSSPQPSSPPQPSSSSPQPSSPPHPSSSSQPSSSQPSSLPPSLSPQPSLLIPPHPQLSSTPHLSSSSPPIHPPSSSSSPSLLRVSLRDLEAEAFRLVLCYIYTDEMEPSREGESPGSNSVIMRMMDVYRQALQLMLSRLEHLCLHYLRSFISLQNVLNALQYADSLHLEEIKDYCLRFTVRDSSYNEIVMSEQFEGVSKWLLVDIVRLRQHPDHRSHHSHHSRVEQSFDVFKCNTLEKDMEVFLQSEGSIFSDVTLKLNQSELRGHKVILAARSSYFEAFFRSFSPQEGNSIDVSTGDHLPTTASFQQLFNFIYTGNLSLTPEQCIYLFPASNYYAFSNNRLQAYCKYNLEMNVNQMNVIQILAAADRIGAVDMKATALDIIVNNLNKVARQGELASLSHSLLLEIIRRLADRLNE